MPYNNQRTLSLPEETKAKIDQLVSATGLSIARTVDRLVDHGREGLLKERYRELDRAKAKQAKGGRS